MAFPTHRLRRLRRTEAIRRMVQETHISSADFIYPLFVADAGNLRAPLPAIPGASLLAGAALSDEAKEIRDLGIPAVILFGVLDDNRKDPEASAAFDSGGPVQRAVQQLRRDVPGLIVITDLCLCEYTSHGHCGLLKGDEIDNDRTLACIGKAALSLAEAGADMIAPSGVMDGVVWTLRTALDSAGHANVMTMPYSAKFASVLYGPFKQATKSAPGESKHATHQVPVPNSREALRKIAQDIEEGADMVIVKPALTNLDILCRARAAHAVPLAAYNVSGEHKMLLSAFADDPEGRTRMMLEALTCIKRAGADAIITYFAKEAARALS